MDEQTGVETGSGVTVPAEAVEAADELARLVRAATVDLPFGTEPALFAAVLERLADAEGAAS